MVCTVAPVLQNCLLAPFGLKESNAAKSDLKCRGFVAQLGQRIIFKIAEIGNDCLWTTRSTNFSEEWQLPRG